MGIYFTKPLGEIGPHDLVVTEEFNEEKINRDLSDSIGFKGNYRFFRIRGHEGGATQVSLEYPTTHDAVLRGWYETKDGKVVPQRILHVGAGLAFIAMPWIFLSLVVWGTLFFLIFRCQPIDPSMTKGQRKRLEILNCLAFLVGVGVPVLLLFSGFFTWLFPPS